MANKGNIKRWITINGVHVPIMEGQTKKQAVNNFIKNTTVKNSNFSNMTRKQLAEYIVDNQIKRGVVKKENRDKQVKARLDGLGQVKAQSKTDLVKTAKDMSKNKYTKKKTIKSDIKKSSKPNKSTNSNNHFSNKSDIVTFVKQQTKIDLSKVLESSNSRSRTYLGVHLDKLSANERNQVKTLLKKYNIRLEDNGGLGNAIYYKKK